MSAKLDHQIKDQILFLSLSHLSILKKIVRPPYLRNAKRCSDNCFQYLADSLMWTFELISNRLWSNSLGNLWL